MVSSRASVGPCELNSITVGVLMLLNSRGPTVHSLLSSLQNLQLNATDLARPCNHSHLSSLRSLHTRYLGSLTRTPPGADKLSSVRAPSWGSFLGLDWGSLVGYGRLCITSSSWIYRTRAGLHSLLSALQNRHLMLLNSRGPTFTPEIATNSSYLASRTRTPPWADRLSPATAPSWCRLSGCDWSFRRVRSLVQ